MSTETAHDPQNEVLPFQMVSPSDYFLKNTEFRVWLKDEKDMFCRLYHVRHVELFPNDSTSTGSLAREHGGTHAPIHLLYCDPVDASSCPYPRIP